ncbi:UNVERIFIED_CONTAM: hypothetical protein RMT77_003299 [Armadillidium vulgare]
MRSYSCSVFFTFSIIIPYKVIGYIIQRPISSYEINNCTCGLDNVIRRIEPRIYGGHVYKPSEFPWLVGFINYGYYYCAGTLINERYIISAAHCFKYYDRKIKKAKYVDLNEVKIILGTNYIDKLVIIGFTAISYLEVTPLYVRFHPRYNPRYLQYDISIVKIDGVIDKYSRRIFPLCLPPVRYKYENVEAFVIGWGYTSKSSTSTKSARIADVKVFPNKECEKKWRSNYKSLIMICAAKKGKDTCTGDSGGPLLIRLSNFQYALIGVTSFGRKCGDFKHPGIYTRVSRFVPWIRRRTEDATYCKN